jgi:hypothetical protein
MPEDLLAQAKRWLVSQGFALEMRTASTFRRAGFTVLQAAHYLDREEGKFRETDVIATHPESSQRAAVHVVAECKASSHPWIILVSADLLRDRDRFQIAGVLSHEASEVMRKLPEGMLRVLPWIDTRDACGYAFRKALGGGRDDGYVAAMSVCKAAQWAVHNHQGDRRELPPLSIAFPVIVVDAPILECHLAADGDIEVNQVAHGEFLFEDHAVNDTVARARVVHIDGLQQFAIDAFQTATAHVRFMHDLKSPTDGRD